MAVAAPRPALGCTEPFRTDREKRLVAKREFTVSPLPRQCSRLKENLGFQFLWIIQFAVGCIGHEATERFVHSFDQNTVSLRILMEEVICIAELLIATTKSRNNIT